MARLISIAQLLDRCDFRGAVGQQPPALRPLHAALHASQREDRDESAPAAMDGDRHPEQPSVCARVAGARAAPLVEHLPGRHRARGPSAAPRVPRALPADPPQNLGARLSRY